MKPAARLAILTAWMIPGWFAAAEAQAPPSVLGIGAVGLTVYTDVNFRGRSTSFRDDVPDMARVGFNRSISSLRVASGERWEICSQANYRGECATVWDEEANLHRSNWGDRIASARRVRGNGGSGGSNARLVLFDQTNYRGNSHEISANTAELRDFNDRARSVTVSRGTWELCEHRNFSGRCATLDRSTPDLAAYGLSGRVTSARLVSGGGGVPPPSQAGYVVLYDGVNFRGNPMRFDRASPNLGQFNGRARSVTVGRGTWELCEGQNFGGRCTVVTSSVADLGTRGMAGRVNSLRPVGTNSSPGPQWPPGPPWTSPPR